MFAVKGYMFEPELRRGEKLSEREREKENKQVKECSDRTVATWGSRPAYDPVGCALWPGRGVCVCMRGGRDNKALLGLTDERWPHLTTAG